MKKILIAFDGVNFSEGAFEFARKMNDFSPVLLTGVFLPQAEYANLWSYGDALTGTIYYPSFNEDEEEAKQKNVLRFQHRCQREGIEYRVHSDLPDFTLPDLKKESRFADLLIIGSEYFYENMGIKEPNAYLQDAIHGVECPVVVVPETYTFPETNILAYDGSASSLYAIKQFAYLFAELTANPTFIAYLANDVDDEMPDDINMEELTSRHFPDLTIEKLSGSHSNFNKWLDKNSNPILVSGSYGRSLFSRLFKKSFISDTIKEHKFPVFVAHK